MMDTAQSPPHGVSTHGIPTQNEETPTPKVVTTTPHRSSGMPTKAQELSCIRDEPTLEALRRDIDEIDNALLDLLAQRQKVVHAVGDYKRARNLPPLDLERWQSMLEALRQKADERGLCAEFVEGVYEHIHEYSLRLEGQPAAGSEESLA